MKKYHTMSEMPYDGGSNLMTVSELERYTKMARDGGNAEVSDMVLALIADWRAMRKYVVLNAAIKERPNARKILEGLKVKP